MSSRPPPDVSAEREAGQQQQQAGAATQAQPEQSAQERRVSHSSAAQRCHTDALQCIYAFLDLKDHAAVSRSCHDWHAAACKEPPRDLRVTIRSPATLDSLVRSPLRRHVAELTTGSGRSPLRMAQLRQLRSLPRLTALDCWLHGADLHAALAATGDSRELRAQMMRDALPPLLRKLAIAAYTGRPAHVGAAKQALLDALPALTQLADLRLRGNRGEQLDFSPLLQLPLLRDLSLECRPTLQQCLVIKQLGALVIFEANIHLDTPLRILLTPPHRLQRLERLGLNGSTSDRPPLALLQQLPALTHLSFSIRPDCWAEVRDIAQLRVLQLCRDDSFTAEQLAALNESFNALPHLSRLDLRLYYEKEGMEPLALRLPAVRRLRLQCVRVPTLDFLQYSPMLEELRLDLCKKMSGADVMASLRAHPPRRLHELHLINCVDLSDEEQAALQPPSDLLPALRTFRYLAVRRRVSHPSIAQSCHTDALHCIFAFLGLKDRARVMRSCRDWQLAVGKEAPRDLSMEIRSAALDGLCASPLRRHVAELAFIYPSRPLRLAELRLLRSLPRLTSLAAGLDGENLYPDSAQPVPLHSREQRAQRLRDALPPQLRKLAIALTQVNIVHDEVSKQVLLDALPAMPQLTDVSLRWRSNRCRDMDLSPLLQLPLLRHLAVDDRLSPQQCAVISQLGELRTVQSPDGYMKRFLDSQCLWALLTPPHRLQRLEHVEMFCCEIDSALLALLQDLPSLTALQPMLIDPDCWLDLRKFGQLRTLSINQYDRFTPTQLVDLVHSINALPHLSRLEISVHYKEKVDTAPLALRLPALRQLSLSNLRLPSLRFVQHSPLLEKIHLYGCKEMSAADVLESLRAHPPSQLRKLYLYGCVNLSAEELAALRPPSALLPALTEFTYKYQQPSGHV